MSTESFTSDTYRAWKAWDPDKFGRYTPIDAIGFRQELEKSGVPLNNPISLFEIGFGNGQFASWARSQGWVIVGTELDKELVARANAFGFEAHGVEQPIDSIAAGRRFDVIVAFDVFEHLTLEELILLLTAARRCLQPSGRIIARFPSGDSPFARSVQHSDLTHKAAIGTGIVRQVARRTGYRVLQIREPVLPIRGVGLVKACRRIGVLSLRKVISAAINVAFHDGQHAIITRNMIAVLQSE